MLETAISTVRFQNSIGVNPTDWCLGVLFFADEERPVAEAFVHNLISRAIELEGTVTGEHGVGLVKRDYLSHEVGETTVDLMRKVRKNQILT
jgi:FAD/FMN-containing dehydrogenase